MRFEFAILGAAAPILLAAGDAPTPLPGWMAGCWIETRDQNWFEECWTAPRGGMMIGSGRAGRGEVLRSWETMQIVVAAKTADGSPAPMAFFGAPEGEGRTMFQLEEAGTNALTFVNRSHDYPQRVRYWRDGERLLAEVSLADGSRPMRWSYRRAGTPEQASEPGEYQP